jgi:quercetin dioxygenase-like cupin family protein
MVVFHRDDADPFEGDGDRIFSYVSPARGSADLCAWRLEVGPDHEGFVHQTNREEVVLVLSGRLTFTLDGVADDLDEGSVVLIAAGSTISIRTGPEGAVLWVTTTRGLHARLEDGTDLTVEWAN